jgi:hypothetical protein
VFLGFWNDGAIVDDGTAADVVGAIIDRNGGIHEVAICVVVPCAQFGELAGAAADGVLMTIGASPGVKHGSQTRAGIVSCFVDSLVVGVGIARGLRDSIAMALRAWILHQSWSVEPCRRFGRGVLRQTCPSHGDNCNQLHKYSDKLLPHRIGLLRVGFFKQRFGSEQSWARSHRETAGGVALFPIAL